MAEFSKQYVELYDNDMGYDFDILEIFNELKPGMYKPIICEGFGFLGVGKSENKELIVAVTNGDDFDEIIWVDYDKFIESFKN